MKGSRFECGQGKGTSGLRVRNSRPRALSVLLVRVTGARWDRLEAPKQYITPTVSKSRLKGVLITSSASRPKGAAIK